MEGLEFREVCVLQGLVRGVGVFVPVQHDVDPHRLRLVGEVVADALFEAVAKESAKQTRSQMLREKTEHFVVELEQVGAFVQNLMDTVQKLQEHG